MREVRRRTERCTNPMSIGRSAQGIPPQSSYRFPCTSTAIIRGTYVHHWQSHSKTSVVTVTSFCGLDTGTSSIDLIDMIVVLTANNLKDNYRCYVTFLFFFLLTSQWPRPFTTRSSSVILCNFKTMTYKCKHKRNFPFRYWICTYFISVVIACWGFPTHYIRVFVVSMPMRFDFCIIIFRWTIRIFYSFILDKGGTPGTYQSNATTECYQQTKKHHGNRTVETFRKVDSVCIPRSTARASIKRTTADKTTNKGVNDKAITTQSWNDRN